MKTAQKADESLAISQEQLVALFSELLGGYPNPEDTTPPGPWDPIIRKALERLRILSVLGPHPEPWHQLPLKASFAAAIAQEVIDRAGLLQELADALPQAGQQQGVSIAGGYLSRFIDDCGNDRLWRKRPFPPRRADKLTALELIVMGATFEQGARGMAHEQLQQEFRQAGAKLTEFGLARRQSLQS